ncbi:MAG: hypothetical protein IJ894_12825, partial [Bacteroidales bacterium]|nr:hypothetical protein [Bacteroidales bacterium]
MRTNLLISTMFAALAMLSSCGDDDGDNNDPELLAPKVKAVLPADGATEEAQYSKVYVLYER